MKVSTLLAVVCLFSATLATAQVRVYPGSSNYTDSAGNVWTPDASYCTTSSVDSGPYSNTITGPVLPSASDHLLYQNYRYNISAPFSCTFNVVNGTYLVTLKADDPHYTAAGQRVFNVTLNSAAWLTNFDVIALAGAQFQALDETQQVAVSNGSLVIGFSGFQPFYTALSIVPIASPLVITSPATLPQAVAGVAYSFQETASGGVAPYTWSIASGSLPAGLTMSASGLISGTPTSGGPVTFTVAVTDSE